MAFPKTDAIKPFVQAYNRELEKMYEDGRLQQILETYALSMPDHHEFSN
jgi:ABC-type amino acid transport substrate-binding protein